MAHGITKRANGMSEMAYVGEKPWHGLGQELKQGATIEEWQVAAGMDWKIHRSKVRYATGPKGGGMREWDRYQVALRSDTGDPLGLITPLFKIVQPKDALEFFRDLVEVAGFKLETAGTLHGGQKFWALASIGAEERIVGNDLVKGRLMLATACDKSMPTVVKNVAERVVCANTLAIAMGEKGASEVRVKHSSHFRPDDVKAQLGLAVDSFQQFVKDARELAKYKVHKQEAETFLINLLSRDAEEESEELDADVLDNYMAKGIMRLFEGEGRGANLVGVKHTLWGLVNAVTEQVDHHTRAQSTAKRIDQAWFGRGDKLKREAMEQALLLVR